MNYHFMSLGSNCAPILFLGPDRIKGPVDNVVITDAYILKFLIEGTYFDYVTNPKNFEMVEPQYGKGRPADPDQWFIYKYLRILHNDPRTSKYAEELSKRLKVFKEFLNKVRTQDNYYFTFCLNEALVNTNTHTLTDKTLYWVCEYLKKQGLIEKVIFVQTHAGKIPHSGYFNCYIENIQEWKEKYNLKVIDLYWNMPEEKDCLCEQFFSKIKESL